MTSSWTDVAPFCQEVLTKIIKSLPTPPDISVYMTDATVLRALPNRHPDVKCDRISTAYCILKVKLLPHLKYIMLC